MKAIKQFKDKNVSEHPDYFTCTWEQLVELVKDNCPNEDKGEYIINVEEYSKEKAIKWFKEEFEDLLMHNEIYEQIDETEQWYLKDHYQDIFNEGMESFSDEILKFAKNDNRKDREEESNSRGNFAQGIPL